MTITELRTQLLDVITRLETGGDEVTVVSGTGAVSRRSSTSANGQTPVGPGNDVRSEQWPAE